MTRETEHLEQQNAILRTLLAEAHRKLAIAEFEAAQYFELLRELLR